MIHKKNCDNIFIIGNPSQYFFVTEALNQLGLINSKNILIITGFHKGYVNQILTLCKIHNWDKIHVLPSIIMLFWRLSLATRIISFPFAQFYFFLTTKRINILNTTFIGNFNDDRMLKIARFLNSKKLFLLDDGNATLNIFERLKENSAASIFPVSSYFLSKQKNYTLPELTFFTIYHESKNRISTFNVIPNLLKFSKENILMKKFDNETIFIIGSPFIKLKMISKERYYNAIQYIINSNLGLRVVYIKHRAEDNIIIDGVEAINLNEPIEFYLLKSSFIPSKIITFFSSAAVTLHKIFDSKIIVENIDLFKNENPVFNYYKELESSHFLITRID